ncbi:MAG: helix-turn-helix transcriptional regulator [Gemmatimonadetes bacterium]|nr:helix-turn-helix transcriptional regulator [Gemmatimonadota bacterium]
MRGQKPLPEAHPRELLSIGDHVRKRRLDLGLRQKDLARRLGVNVNTVTNWEVGRSTPALWHVPGIIRFLGYEPFETTGDYTGKGTCLESGAGSGEIVT